MVSARICFGGKGKLNFVAEKDKVSEKYYLENLLLHLMNDCQKLLPFQQDGTRVHTAKLAQEWIKENCPEFIKKDEWHQNLSNLNLLDYHVWGAMSELCQFYGPKPKTIEGLKDVEKQYEKIAPGTN